MAILYRILQPPDIQVSRLHQEFASDVLLGLSRSPKSVPCKYLYDAEGARLFREIMELPEYYLTRCELEILQERKDGIANLVGGSPFNLVDLGAGDGRKTETLLEHFLKRELDFQYVPIDISESAVHGLVERLSIGYPHLRTEGLVADYFDGLKWLSDLNEHHNVVLFLGSNIGNFSHSEARAFLHCLWNALNDGDYILIGFDLKKDIQQLLAAYNDSRGITAEFNLNLLRRINRELGGIFDLDRFKFHSMYNPLSGAVESYLVSCERQVVDIEALKQSFRFEAGELLHTENSYKFLDSDIVQLAEETGFNVADQLHDSSHCFMDSLWQVRKRPGNS